MSAEQPVDTAAEPSAGSEEASYVGVLAGVPAKKMAKLEARLKAVPDLSSEGEEMDDLDISGSDSFSDPEYLPGVDDGEDDSDSSEDEVFHTPPEWAFYFLTFSSSQKQLVELEALLSTCLLPPSGPWWTPPPGLAGCPWRMWDQCFPLSWCVSSASIYNLLAVSYVI